MNEVNLNMYHNMLTEKKVNSSTVYCNYVRDFSKKTKDFTLKNNYWFRARLYDPPIYA